MLVLVAVVLLMVLTEVMLQVKMAAMVLTLLLLLLLPSLAQEVMEDMVEAAVALVEMVMRPFLVMHHGVVLVLGLVVVQVVQQAQAQVVLMALKVASSYTIAEKGERL